LVRETLLDTVVVSGLQYVGEVLEEERTQLCGRRYRHDPQRRAGRAGAMPSSLTLGGRPVQVVRLMGLKHERSRGDILRECAASGDIRSSW
jgi:hypothetical protein